MQPDVPGGSSPNWPGPPWGSFDTSYQPFEPNHGDTQSMPNAAAPDCDKSDTSNPGSGNPIALTTGNKVEIERDFASSGEMGLYLERTYNHFWNHVGLFGKHWLSNLDYSLTLTTPQGSIWAQRPDGRRIKFVYVGNNRWDEDKAGPVAYIVKHPDSSFTHYTEEHTLERYREDGRVLRVENRQGVGWTFSYVVNYLALVKHDSGRQIGFGWTDGKLTTVIDPGGRDYTYAYDHNAFGNGVHRLKSATLPGAPATTVTYHYEMDSKPGALTGKSFNGVRYSTFAYDGAGRTILSEHAGGVDRHTYFYQLISQQAEAILPMVEPPDPPPPGAECHPETGVCVPPLGDGDPNDPELLNRAAIAQAADELIDELTDVVVAHVDETHPQGRQTRYRVDDDRLVEVIGTATQYCAASDRKRTYDSRGYEDTVEDFNGNVTDYTYNDQGQLLTRIEGFGTGVARTLTNAWDVPNNRITKMTVAGDREESYAYTASHRLQSVTVKNLSPHGVPNQTRTATYGYTEHPNGLVASVTIDGPRPGTGDAVTYQYTDKGDLFRVVNSLSHVVLYSNHTALGQPQRIDGINGERTDFVYDARGRMTRMRTFRNGGQQDTVYAYNGAGLLQSMTTPDGVTETYTYDAARRLKEISRNEPGGTAKRVLTYSANSQVTREDLYRGNTLHYRAYTDYDELGRVRARRGTHGQNIRYGYDTNDNLKTITDSLNTVTTFDYDARNRLIQQTDPLGGITRLAYDAGDRIKQVTDPRNFVTTYAFDGFGQLRSQTSPDSGTTTHTWDAGGLHTSTTRADNVTISYGHDTLGRRTSATAGGQSRSFTYDNCTGGKGRLCFMGVTGYSENLSYTPYGELTNRQITANGSPVNLSHSFQHDAQGRLSKIIYPNGVEATYAYTLDRVTSLTVTINGQTKTVANTITYEPMGPVTQLAFGNGGGRIHYYDTDYRLTDIVTDLKVGYHFDFDANDRITGYTNFANGEWSYGFGHDELHRLKSATSPGLGSQSLTYDPNGNRKTQNAMVYTIAGSSNRLMSEGGRSYAYSLTGNVKTITGFGVGNGDDIFRNCFQFEQAPVTTFTYDPFDRLTGVTGPDINASYKRGPTARATRRPRMARPRGSSMAPTGCCSANTGKHPHAGRTTCG